jgi:hypothetical protein
MKGGGSWEEYCTCCGLPMALRQISSFNNIGPDFNVKKKEKVLDEVSELSADWMTSNIGLDYYHNLKFNLRAYDDYGRVRLSDDQEQDAEAFLKKVADKDFFHIGSFKAASGGVALHKDCLSVIETEIGREITPEDGLLLSKLAKPSKQYQDQSYQWELALIGKGHTYFENPVINNRCMKRVLIANAEFIKKAKRNMKVTKKAGKRSRGKTRRL